MLYNIIVILFLSGSFVAGVFLGLGEGSECSWRDSPGRCVSVFQCLSSFIDIQDKKYAPICSFRGNEPIICCTDCELVEDTRKIIIHPKFAILLKTGRKAEDACTEFKATIDDISRFLPSQFYLGREFNPGRHCYDVRIESYNTQLPFGGTDAKSDEFPHMALLGYGPDMDSAQWLCAGSVISERFVLTAGHCLSEPQLGEVKYIALGVQRRSDSPKTWQKYNVKRRVRHPEYKPPSQYNDIALLETDKKIRFNAHVIPACLHTQGKAVEMLSSSGWGALGHRKPLADVMQKIDIYRYEERECLQHYPSHRHLKRGYNHTTQMCYGGRGSVVDTCQGDSGGPLQSMSYDDHACMFTILGVTSAGKQCGLQAIPGLYTRVYHYVPWIESIVWP